MNKPNRRMFLIILAVVSSVLIVIRIREFTLMIGSPVQITSTPDPLEKTLSSTISRYRTSKISIIEFSAITEFDWDELYIFGPYTDAAELDLMVGKSWRSKCSTQIATSDSYTLLVFTKNHIVVHCLDYPRGENYFFVPARGYETGFSPEEAIFVIDEQGRIILKDNK